MKEITPGPWVAEEIRRDETTDFNWMVSTRAPIAETLPNDDFFIATFYGPDAEANARAIAAVPELIEAAEPIAAVIDELSDPSKKYASAVMVDADLLRALRSALLKTGGEK